MIPHPRHDYLLFTAVLILLLAAFGAFALHYGGATAAAGKAVYHPCQELYVQYLNNNCNTLPGQNICISIMQEKERRFC